MMGILWLCGAFLAVFVLLIGLLALVEWFFLHD